MKYGNYKTGCSSISGFSMVELIATVSALAIIATVSVMAFGNTQGMVRSTKLDADVKNLNQIVSVYLANGGSLTGITDPQAVLNRLKTVLTKDEITRNVGVMTGSGVDARLTARMQSSTEVGSSGPRAIWDSAKQRFALSSVAGVQGVSAFDLDGNLAGIAASNDKRAKSNVLYNGSAGWVWENGTSNGPPPLSPSGRPLTDLENKYNPLASNPPTGGTPPTATPPASSPPPPGPGPVSPPTIPRSSPPPTLTTGAPTTPIKLPTPIISPSGGAFYKALFPSLIFINPNGAAEGSSYMEYRLNNGPWIIYTGPFSVASGTTVIAKNFSTNPALYTDSDPTAEGYFALVTSFAGAVAAKWNPSTGPSTLVSTVSNTNPDEVIERDGTATSSSGPGQNAFIFKREASFSGVAPNTEFKIGQITYHNGTIRSGTGSTGLSLHLDLTLKDPSVGTTGTNILMKLENTRNSSGGANAKSADACTLANPVTDYSITIGGVTYTLILKYGTIDISEGFVSGDTLNVWEGADGEVDILAVFASTVPQTTASSTTIASTATQVAAP